MPFPNKDTQFKPGQSGNPAGRKAVGALVLDHMGTLMNLMEKGELKFEELGKIAESDPNGNRRIAAIRLLHAGSLPDLERFDGFLKGEKTLPELKAAGVDTSLLKKAKVRKRVEWDADKKPVIHEEREIELADRSGEAFDRVLDRLVGKPDASLKVSTEPEPEMTPARAAEILAELGVTNIPPGWLERPKDEPRTDATQTA